MDNRVDSGGKLDAVLSFSGRVTASASDVDSSLGLFHLPRPS